MIQILIILSSLLLAEQSMITKIGQKSENVNQGMCECGVFRTKDITPGQQPILTHKTINVTCPSDDTCTKICTGIAQTSKARDQGPKLLCAALGTADNLTISVFVRTCDDKHWNYTGLSCPLPDICPQPICCREKLPVSCQQLKIDDAKTV